MLHMLFLFTMVRVESVPGPNVKSVLNPIEETSLLQVEAQHYPETTHTIHTTWKPHTTTHTIHHNWHDSTYTDTDGDIDGDIDGDNDGALDDGQIDDGSPTSVVSSWHSLRDATIVASSSLTGNTLPTNLKGNSHSVWVSAGASDEWLTFKFPNGQTVDGIRFYNVKANYFFKIYTLSMSENDGHDWYPIKDDVDGSNTVNLLCCDYYEMRFPVVHANMFKLFMSTNWGGAGMSLSYVEFHFLPDPDTLCPYFSVPFKENCYAVMDRALYSEIPKAVVSKFNCQDPLRLPLGWVVAVFSQEVVDNVVKSAVSSDTDYRWGTQNVVLANNLAYLTSTGVAANSITLTDNGDGLYSPNPDNTDGGGSCNLGQAKVFMEMPWSNTTDRFNPPFVYRDDNPSYNNLVFEKN